MEKINAIIKNSNTENKMLWSDRRIEKILHW